MESKKMIQKRKSSTDVQREDKRRNTKGNKKEEKGDGDHVDRGEDELPSVLETVRKSEQDIQEHDQMMTLRFIKQFYPHVIPIEDEEELLSQEEQIKNVERPDKRSAHTTYSETSALSNKDAEINTDSNTETFSHVDGSSLALTSGPGKKQFSCQICRKIFVKEVDLSIHMASHKVVSQRICGVCRQCFPDGDDFRAHKCVPAKGLSACPHCGKYFASVSAVNIHIRVHTGERPHTCLICGKAFTQKGNLQCHLRIHTGERPFKCDQCERTFIQKIQLTQHLMSHKNLNLNNRSQYRSQQ